MNKGLRLLLGGLVGAAVLYGAAWGGTAALLRREIAGWLAAQGATGLDVRTGPLAMSGFPGRVVATVPDLAVAAPVTGAGWMWRAPRVVVSTWPLRLRTLDLDLAGTHLIAVTAGTANVPAWIAVSAMGGRLSLDLAGRLTGATLQAADIRLALAEDGPPLVRADSARAEVALRLGDGAMGNGPTGPATARLAIEALGVTPPPLFGLPPAAPIVRAALIAELTGQFPAGPLPQVLEAWRSGGGTLEVREAELVWPPIRVAGSGTLALDDRLQPLASLSLQVQGGAETLDGLMRAGVLAEAEGGIAKLGLALLSRKNGDGVSELAVPLTLQDGRLAAGPLALGTLPPIAWPRIAVP
jgi:hypothetical protein